MIVCSCSNPVCLINGCQQAIFRSYKPYTEVNRPGITREVIPISEERVRNIIREELQKFKAGA